jgi:uncharacterized protein (DUF427 family)
VRVVLGGVTIAQCAKSWRVLETAGAPVHYLDPRDVLPGVLVATDGESWCEWKGRATYYDLVVPPVVASRAAWCYHDPSPAYAAIAHHVAIYASRVDACFLGDERVEPQPGDFYGGWITSAVTGPFKGGPGSAGW